MFFWFITAVVAPYWLGGHQLKKLGKGKREPDKPCHWHLELAMLVVTVVPGVVCISRRSRTSRVGLAA
jgi:hypothetical protein